MYSVHVSTVYTVFNDTHTEHAHAGGLSNINTCPYLTLTLEMRPRALYDIPIKKLPVDIIGSEKDIN